MSTLNWCEIGSTKTHRYDVLSQHLSSKGIQNQFTFIETSNENLKEKIEEAQSQKQVIRLNPKFFDAAIPYINKNLRDLEKIKAIDGLHLTPKNEYWPEILFKDALIEYLTIKVKNLDVSQKVFVVGACGMARAVIAALIKLGYSKINITSDNESGAEELIQDFKNIFFHVEFEFTKKNDVTILPGIHGIVVNTFSVLESDMALNEIYYFNFLKKGGLVVDLIDVPTDSPFTKIAKDIGAEVIAGYEFLAYYDLKWVEMITGQKLELEPYQALLKTNLEQVSYDKNKIQKILEEFQM